MAEFAMLPDLKAHLNITSDADDDELTMMLEAADELVRSMVGTFAGITVTERAQVSGGTVVLQRRPVDDVLIDDGAVTGFTVSSAAGVLYDVPAWGSVTVTYTASGGLIPASVTLATLIIASHLWQTQRVPGVGEGRPPGFGGGGTASWVPTGFAIPKRAEELLRPYMQGGQLA